MFRSNQRNPAHSTHRHNNKMFRNLSIGITCAWFTVFAIIPCIILLLTSLLSPGDPELLRLQFSLNNFTKLLNPVYGRIFFRSFFLAASCTSICLCIAYPFSYIIARMQHTAKHIWLLLVTIPFWTSSLVRSYALMAILKTHGLINHYLMRLHLIDTPCQFLYTNTATMLGLVYTLLPLMILPLYAHIEKLDQKLLDAARDLGASNLQVFRKIIIPLTMPGILAGCMLVMLPAMTIFYIPDLLGGARTVLLGNLIQTQFITARNWPMGASISVTITLIIGLSLWVYVKKYRSELQG
jgi:spermidine/putrescine transport system permease protein